MPINTCVAHIWHLTHALRRTTPDRPAGKWDNVRGTIQTFSTEFNSDDVTAALSDHCHTALAKEHKCENNLIPCDWFATVLPFNKVTVGLKGFCTLWQLSYVNVCCQHVRCCTCLETTASLSAPVESFPIMTAFNLKRHTAWCLPLFHVTVVLLNCMK